MYINRKQSRYQVKKYYFEEGHRNSFWRTLLAVSKRDERGGKKES